MIFTYSLFIGPCLVTSDMTGYSHKTHSLQCPSKTEGKNQTLVGAIPFCGEYPGPRFEDKFRSANQIDGISIADEGKMIDS